VIVAEVVARGDRVPIRHPDESYAGRSRVASSKADAREDTMRHPTVYRTVSVDGISIFYREAGPPDGPTLLLLHGLPSSSRMFEPLFTRLADHVRMIAPDCPGSGHSGDADA
jgi:hypothetical protein